MPLKRGLGQIGHNIKEMEAAGHPRSQAVAAALHTAYDRASGGAVMTGPLNGATPGRADQVPVKVPNGAHVIPADVVAALGDGNNAAGMLVLQRIFPGKMASGVGVDINASDGEFVVTPENVKQFGGHQVLNHFIVNIRHSYAHKLKQLPGPEG